MKDLEQQSFPRWETSVFKVANANTVLSALFHILFVEGHFSTDASTMRAGLGFDNPRDQSIFEALEDFVAHMPPPSAPDEVQLRAALDEFAVSAQRLDELIPGVSKRLIEFVVENPGYMYSTWPDELIIADRAKLGWVFVSKEPIVEDGLPLGTAYTFRRVAVDNIIYGEHKTTVMPCMGIRQDVGAMCGSLIGLVLDVGPAALCCPVCGCLYIVDPLVEAENANEIQGHRVEIILSEKSIPSRFRDIESFLMAKIGSLARIYRAPVYSGPGGGFDFFDEISERGSNE